MATIPIKSTFIVAFIITTFATIYLSSADSIPYQLAKAAKVYKFRYEAGRRVVGDYSVYNETISRSYGKVVNASIKYDYPRYGLGKNVTFVQIQVQQSSPISNAYIYKGGIGQRFIGFNVTGTNTNFLNATFYIYGK